MSKTLDLGTRVELQPADKHCDDISLSLYQRQVDGHYRYLVHTYADTDAARQRVSFMRTVLQSRMGMQPTADDADWLQFPCGASHLRAVQRGFLDLTKLANGDDVQPLPLTVFDKKADCNMTAAGDGHGGYTISAEKQTGQKRVKALARGFVKLCEMDADEDQDAAIQFTCNTSHDAMIGQLMYRAQNVRAAMAEQEQAATRGVLSAPSAQE